MKKQHVSKTIRPNGILRWSTVCILAGGAAALTSCDNGVRYVATEEDVDMARTQTEIEKLESDKNSLITGEVAHNFHLPRVGYYHAEARQFFEHPHGYQKDGRWFINGVWQDQMVETRVTSSRPTPEALMKVEAALAEEQKTVANSPGYHGHGSGLSNALMMYWLLSGNRGFFSPGTGFRQANAQAGNWQRQVDDKRNKVDHYASVNPGYKSLVEQSRSSGAPIKAGQSVRGGFGTTSSSRFSFGS